MSHYLPLTGDDAITRGVLHAIHTGSVKGRLARRILVQARYDDASEANSLTTSWYSRVVHNEKNPQNANGGKP